MSDSDKLVADKNNEHVKRLTKIAEDLDVYRVAKPVLKDPRFSLWSGSSKCFQHHYGKGGLAQHTCEVVELCFQNRKYYEGTDYKFMDEKHVYEWGGTGLDEKELFLAALFHDTGKMHDYCFTWDKSYHGDVTRNFNKWESTKHKRLIHHISRSGIIWSKSAVLDEEIYEKYHDNVLHAILAHHGQREFGSPVAPKTRVAWLLHLCDGISARMYDADTLDVIDRK
jgi:3'-5' exoribonuclease